MPDDTLDFTPVPTEDLLASTETVYYECAQCAIKPGSPVLCAECLERRAEFSDTGRTRKPTHYNLHSDRDRRTYLSYLRVHRDQEESCDYESWTEEDLEREFPDRNNPLLRTPQVLGFDIRQVRPVGAPIVAPRTPTSLVQVFQDVHHHLTQIYTTLGVPSHMLMGTDLAAGSDRTVMATYNFNHVYGRADATLARATATWIAMEHDIDIEDAASWFMEHFSVQDIRHLLLRLGFKPDDLGLEPTYPNEKGDAEKNMIVLRFMLEASLSSETPPPVRYEHDPLIEENPAPTPLDPPRDCMPTIYHGLADFLERRPKDKAVWERLNGSLDDIRVPTRHERINWNNS